MEDLILSEVVQNSRPQEGLLHIYKKHDSQSHTRKPSLSIISAQTLSILHVSLGLQRRSGGKFYTATKLGQNAASSKPTEHPVRLSSKYSLSQTLLSYWSICFTFFKNRYTLCFQQNIIKVTSFLYCLHKDSACPPHSSDSRHTVHMRDIIARTKWVSRPSVASTSQRRT